MKPHLTRARLQAGLAEATALLLFVAVTVAVRGLTIADWTRVNPDEAELLAQAHAAQDSFLPFTTWTMGTTGPWWPMFLALVGWLGFPLTLASAHLPAVMVGAMGYVVFVLIRRTWGARWGLALATLWWLPLALIYPVGFVTDFGALNTELLPVVLVLLAAAVPTRRLTASPWIFVFPGLLGALAVGAKYQALPVVAALLCAQLLAVGKSPRSLLTSLGWWVAGAAAPYALLALALVISPDVSSDLIRDNLGFLGSYAERVTLSDRLANTVAGLPRPFYLIALLAFLARLAWLSSPRVLLARAILVAGGATAVIAGGMGFGHYFWMLYAACALAAALPVKDGAELIPWRPVRIAAVPAAAAAIAAVLAAGLYTTWLTFTSPAVLADALDERSTPRDTSVQELCPAGSDVLVWGWAPELYVYYSWDNTVPFMNSLGLNSSTEAREASAPTVDRGIERADCVVDATGEVFFNHDPGGALPLVYPATASVLERDFRAHRGEFDCADCTVYVRE